jgi:hypothetical protein
MLSVIIVSLRGVIVALKFSWVQTRETHKFPNVKPDAVTDPARFEVTARNQSVQFAKADIQHLGCLFAS